MTTATKEFFSASVDGQGVKIAATSSAGTTVHTAHATLKDEIWLWLYNGHSAAVAVTIQFGGTSSPDDDIKLTIANQNGLFLAISGMCLSNSKVLKIYAATTNVIVAHGFVNRITNG